MKSNNFCSAWNQDTYPNGISFSLVSKNICLFHFQFLQIPKQNKKTTSFHWISMLWTKSKVKISSKFCNCSNREHTGLLSLRKQKYAQETNIFKYVHKTKKKKLFLKMKTIDKQSPTWTVPSLFLSPFPFGFYTLFS